MLPALWFACACTKKERRKSSGVSERKKSMDKASLPYPVPLGNIVLTVGAVAALEQAGQTPEQLLARHSFGDWGEADPDDWMKNDDALQNGLRLLSCYRLRDNTKVWVITEWDRSSTTILLPEEY
jgi:hypothetical protein